MKPSECNSEYLQQSIQMQLSKKKKTFSQFFPEFLKSVSNSKHFEKKYDPYSLCISELTDCERLA